jgi:hypothetical protein
MSTTESSKTLNIPVEDLARWARTQRIVNGHWGDEKIFTLQKPRMGKILRKKMKASLEGVSCAVLSLLASLLASLLPSLPTRWRKL